MQTIHTQPEIESYRIINMLRRVFESIDPRLMRHGERVAFLVDKLYTTLPECTESARNELLVLALLHDIGAYKTEEIDDMMRFETLNIWPHAVYGYLFLSTTTRLGDSAEAILYHHAPWSALRDLNINYKQYAALIHLADRIDVLTQSDPDNNLSSLQTDSGSLFCPEYVDTFFRLEKEQHLVGQMLDGSYIGSVEEIVQSLALPVDEIIEYLGMIVYAIDFRSPFTVTHTANTVAISVELGRLFSLSERERDALELGAFLHDIGKIFIPLEILESPDKLSDEEMAIMRTHVVKTGEIIGDFVSDEVCRIAVRHHEKLNGHGYPLGLTAKDLTLPERIVGVADVLSALINRRSYKEPFPPEQTRAIIKKMRDHGELSAEVCDMLLTRYDEIMEHVNAWVGPVVAKYETMLQSFAELGERVASLSL